MPYVARKRLLVGETDLVIGQEAVGLRRAGERRVGTDLAGNPVMEDVFEPQMADVHAKVYREVGELVPEVDTWPNIQPWVDRGHIVYVSDAEADAIRERAARNAKAEDRANAEGKKEGAGSKRRSGTVKAVT